MPFWVAAVLSAALFFLGLAGLLRPRDERSRALSATLMLNGALLIAVAAARDLGALDGQALALLMVGVIAAEAVLGSWTLRKP